MTTTCSDECQATADRLALVLLLVTDGLTATSYAESLRALEPGWSMTRATDPRGEPEVTTGVHVVLLDLDFPNKARSLELCRRTRALRKAVVALTSDRDERTRLQAFAAGADHCLPKAGLELGLLRDCLLIAAQRGAEPLNSRRLLRFGRLAVDLATQVVLVDDDRVSLANHQLHILLRLASSAGRVVPRGELCAAAEIQPGPGYKNLHNEVSRLVRRLGAASRSIRCLRGQGYQLVYNAPSHATGNLPRNEG